jgi:N-acetyl-gamma-glutamyl-phosphate reductase
VKCAVIGASGYAGGELLRLLLGQHSFEIAYLAAGANAGEQVGQIHPHLSPIASQVFEPISIERMNECELLFFALPHGQSAQWVSSISTDSFVVDLGADFRLKSPDAWRKYYGGDHAGSWVYGLPEIHGNRAKVQSSKRVANPGCYATAISLGIAPLIADGLIDSSDVTVVAASGTTGAGRSAKVNLLASEVSGNMSSYKFGGVHQHIPEIEETLSEVASREVKCSFTPILAPMPRGILATVTAKSLAGSEKALVDSMKRYFSDETFIEILENSMPSTSAVLGTNRAQIRVALDAHTQRAIVSVAIDNLGKGAAGQALQNANLMTGLKESNGLLGLGVR